MKAIIQKRATCRLCESSNVEMVVPLEPVPVAEKYLTENEINEDTDLYPIDLYSWAKFSINISAVAPFGIC